MNKLCFENGVHRISNEDYHGSSGISRSAIMEFRKSPYHYWYSYLSPDRVKEEPTDAMNIGNLVHALVLEPEEVPGRFIVKPEFDKLPEVGLLKDLGREEYDRQKKERERQSKENDEIKSRFAELSKDRTVISRSQFEEAASLANALLDNEYVKNLIIGSKVEHSIYFEHKPTGLQCKVRPDAWMSSIVTDIKTAHDARYQSFQREAINLGYFLQAGMTYEAFKSLGMRLEKFVFAVVEKKKPYAVAILPLSLEAVDHGVGLFDLYMEQIARCIDSNKWPSYEVQELLVPNWASNLEGVVAA